MPEKGNSIRFLAPVGLIVFTIVLIVVIVTSSGGGDGKDETSGADKGRTTRTVKTTKTATQKTTEEPIYVVKSGDNLATISEKTGVPMADIEVLNPDIDPRALVEGQKIKLK